MLKTFSICGVQMHSFTIMLGLGMLLALRYVFVQCGQLHLKGNLETKIISAFPFGIIFGAIFAHLFDVAAHAGFKGIFSASIFEYGITFQGYVIGIIFYLFIHSKFTNINYIFLLNFYLPLLAIAQALGRIGCFLGGCCYGKPCSWGAIYPDNSLAYNFYPNTPLFPIQLLESAYLFCVFLIIKYFIKFSHAASVYLFFLSTGRFAFEFLRGDNRGDYVFNLMSPAQTMSLLLLSFAFLIFYTSSVKKKSLAY